MIYKYSTADLVNLKKKPEDFAQISRLPISLILSNVRSLQNVGLIFRLVDAFLIEKIYLTGFTGYPPFGQNDPRPKGIQEHALNQIQKTAINLLPFIPWGYQEDPVSLIEDLQKKSYQIVSLEQTSKSIPYYKGNYVFPLALILGHERTGIDKVLIELSDLVIDIPMLGMGNSHNVAMSAAIVLSEIVNHRLVKIPNYKHQ